MRGLTTTLMVFLWVIGFTASAQADTELQVNAGFVGRVVEGTMTPLHFHAEHQGAPLTGQLIVEQTVETPYRGTSTETLTTRIELGQRANKSWTLYFPLQSIVYPLNIRLIQDDGEIIVEETLDLRDIGQNEPLVVALSDSSFPPELPTSEKILSLSPEEIPDHVSAFEAIRRLYLGAFNLSELSTAQQQALLHWVMLGGELVVFSGENWYIQETPMLSQWLPVAPDTVAATPFGDQEIFILTGNVQGQVLQLHEEQPLLVRRSVGQGRVWLSTINPLAAEVDFNFWQHLQPVVVAALGNTPFPSELPTEETIVQLDPKVVPTDVNGFESIKRLYLGDFNLSDLTAAQRRAMEQWLTLGGELVILAGDNWPAQESAFLNRLMPLDDVTLQRVRFDDGQTLDVLVGAPRGQVQTVHFKENRPWLLRRDAGRGLVWLSTMNPLHMDVPASFWNTLKPRQDVEADQTFEQLSVEIFDEQPLEVPAKAVVGAMLVVFIAGAALWTWMSLKKTVWLWILLGWTAGSGAVFWMFVNQPHYTDALTHNEYGIETVLPDGQAFSDTWIGLYAQRRDVVDFQFPAHYKPWQQLPQQRGEHLFDLEYAVDTTTQLQVKAHPQQKRVLRGTATHPAHLSWKAVSGGVLEVTSHLDLKQVWMLHQGKILAIGPLAAGQTRQVQIDQLAPMEPRRQLPEPTQALWSWVLGQKQPPTLLAAWHDQSDIQPADPWGTYRLIVAEVKL